MVVFLGYYFIFLFFSLSRKKKKSYQNLSLICLFFSLSILLIIFTPFFSQYHSKDYLNYLSFYKTYNDKNFSIEFSYKLLKRLLYSITDNSYFFFFLISALSLTIIFYVCWKESKYPLLSIFLYLSYLYFTDGVTTIRAGLSSSIFLLSVYYLKNNQRKKAFLLCILATLTHNTGIFSFIIFILNQQQIKKKRWIFILIIGILFSLLNIFSISNIITILPFPISVKDKLNIYLSLTGMSNSNKANIFSIGNLIQICFTLVYLYNLKDSQKRYILNIKLYIISYFLLCIFSSFDTIPFRLSQYFVVSEILLWPSFISMFKRRENQGIVYLICVFYGFFRILMHFRTGTLL